MGSALRPARRRAGFFGRRLTPKVSSTFLKVAGEKKAGASDEAPAFFEGGALGPGPQALLQAYFWGWEPFAREKALKGAFRSLRRAARGRCPAAPPPLEKAGETFHF